MSATNNKKDFLGKGIRSLLQNIDNDLKKTTVNLAAEASVLPAQAVVNRVALKNIIVNPKQPRHDFDETALKELAASIKLHDIIQPLTVTKISDNKYQLISGERRWRASQIAGLLDVPVYIRQANDAELLELALLENLQRENLNAIEIALSYRRLMDDINFNVEQVAERMAKDRSTVTNYLRLLKLPPDVQIGVRNSTISMGHARAIINVAEVEKQLFIFNEIIKKGLSVRQTEDLVRQLYSNKKSSATTGHTMSGVAASFKKIEDTLASHFGTKAKLTHSKKGHGSITLEYYNIHELNKLLDLMQVKIN
jgi:ParB family transcriptional regulator, chromosome partitioning protein